ncbi:hypothetical protein HPB52_025098 [Rhipicephalus sanguineus]|uniref:Uncharacterized protein n=1 Tax=Rhipicephalus sanguineus TaxID=34632 RepID=A0A9D4TDH4_RHISA|nr:hypothetical protein HPB52_025098 [Rhipicephalus sanguineus]
MTFSEVHCLPKIPRPPYVNRGNPMELYDEEQFHARYRFTKNAVRQLLAMLPLQESGTTEDSLHGDLVRIPQSTVCRAAGKVTLLIAKHLCSMLVRFPQPAGFPKVMTHTEGLCLFRLFATKLPSRYTYPPCASPPPSPHQPAAAAIVAPREAQNSAAAHDPYPRFLSPSNLYRGTWIEIHKQDDAKHESNISKKPQESGSCTGTHLRLRPLRAFERE